MKAGCRRRGVASVLGMIFMVLVFMAAVGAEVYVAGSESQASVSGIQAQQRLSQKAGEDIAFSFSGGGVTATDTGPTSETVVGVVLKFDNGTVYDLGGSTSPSVTPAQVESGGSLPVASLVPTGVCSPGTSTCLAKYGTIVGGQVSGRAVGVITSMGNSFWYFPTASSSSTSGTFYRTKTSATVASSAYTAVNGLAFAGAANTFYQVQFAIAYFQASSSNPAATFAISVPAGTTFLFCGGLSWANPAQSTTDFPVGNLCTTQQNTSLGPATNTQTLCTVQNVNMCEFVGSAFVSFGSSGGTFQVLFASASNDLLTVTANSVIFVGPGQ